MGYREAAICEKPWGRPPVRGREQIPRVARIAPGPPTRSAERGSNDLLALAASRAALGDTSAVRFLHARLADEVHACVSAIVRRPATARRIAERVFAELPDRIASYRPRELPFDVWLLGIATEAAIERVGHETPANGSAPAGEPEHDAPPRQTARDAVWALPPDERCVLVLRHLVGLSAAQVAGRLRKSEGAIRRLDERGGVALRAGLRGSADRSAVA